MSYLVEYIRGSGGKSNGSKSSGGKRSGGKSQLLNLVEVINVFYIFLRGVIDISKAIIQYGLKSNIRSMQILYSQL